MRILIFDSRYEPRDGGRFPRWSFRSGPRFRSQATGWLRQDGRFLHTPARDAGSSDDWLIYRHWDPARDRYGPVRDFYAYNGGELPAENEVSDLALEARLVIDESVESISVALRSGWDQFLVRIPVRRQGEVELTSNGPRIDLTGTRNPLHQRGSWPRAVTLEASVFDHRVLVAIDGQLLFDPVDYQVNHGQRRDDLLSGESPIALGVRGGNLEVPELRIHRDLYYTNVLANTPRTSFAMRGTVHLGPDNYFVLGDNSPVSNDSRFWTAGPVVPGSMLLGKPFLVHLPGQVVPLKVFGRSVCWVPDPRRIRYIR
jgi:signal peptidase I